MDYHVLNKKAVGHKSVVHIMSRDGKRILCPARRKITVGIVDNVISEGFNITTYHVSELHPDFKELSARAANSLGYYGVHNRAEFIEAFSNEKRLDVCSLKRLRNMGTTCVNEILKSQLCRGLTPVVEPSLAKVNVLLKSLERIANYKLEDFMGPHDMALQCVDDARNAIRKVGR